MLERFGSLDASDGSRDSDQDGYSDRLEYLYDTDPLNADEIPPPGVQEDYIKEDPKEISYGVIAAAVIGVLFLIIISIGAFIMWKKQKQQEPFEGDTVLMYREKTKSDVDYDESESEEEKAEENNFI